MARKTNINFKKIEKKWQERWEKKKIFEVKEKTGKKKYYILEMFPYPSGTGLHMGHALNYTIGDVYARFKRMQGFNLLYPMGYDSLGLPAENAAIKAGKHPRVYTEKSIKNFISQQKSLGISYDWSRMIITNNPEYYKWDQWIFLKMFEKGLAFKKKAPVNWCPKCKTVLANEQVHNGKCWRHEDTDVEIKQLEQWYLKITKYTKELNNFSKLNNWPDLIKKLQKNWIGESYGTEIWFNINNEKWKVFTTRPDTIYGVTFMVISAQHPKLLSLVSEKQKNQVEKFLKKIKSVSEKQFEELEKEGVFTGSFAINPLTEEKIPIWVGNFVVADYGSGMVMAVPAHDQRDYEFAKKYNLPIKEVVREGNSNIKEKACTVKGILINSQKFSGLNSEDAIDKISEYLEKKKLGKKAIKYKLRDWLISRQRYWGTPIPVVYCDSCGLVPVPEKQLPIELPEKVKFGKGNPLTTNKNFINTKCPKCGGKAKRETDTMDTFVNSSWYFLRYIDSKNKKEIFDKKKARYWSPADLYIGGKEHACMHLIYSRFYTKFLRDIGLLKIDEPFIKLFNQGYLYGLDGKKMSKSQGNVIDPSETITKYGADSLRMYLVSVASPDSDFNWNDKEMQGTSRFVLRILDYFSKINLGKSGEKVESRINQGIQEITGDIDSLKYNHAIIKLRKLWDYLFEREVSRKDIESFLKMLSVFCPHIAEELWEKLGNKTLISIESWPKADIKKINKNFAKQDKVAEKIIEDINNILKILEGKQERKDKVFLYVLPKEKELYIDKEISERVGKETLVFAVNDKTKYDPTNKSKNAKPGKPAIYLE